MIVATPSRRLLAVTLLQIVLFALAVVLIGADSWPALPFQMRIVLAFLLMGVALAVGWLGAAWARRARPEIPYSEELESIRRQTMRRSRFVFATLFGLGGGVVGAFAPPFASSPRWVVVILGVVIGALAGAIVGHLGAAQSWMSRVPRTRSAAAPDTSLESTRDR